MGTLKGLTQLFAKPALTYTSSTDDNGVGRVAFDEEGNQYRWVQNKHSAAVTVGQVVCFATANNGATFLQKVYDGATAELANMAGVVMAASLTADYYGWIQIQGFYSEIQVFAYQVDPAIVIGDSLIPINAKAYVGHGAPLGTAPLYHRQIIALEALASDTPTTAMPIAGYIQCA